MGTAGELHEEEGRRTLGHDFFVVRVVGAVEAVGGVAQGVVVADVFAGPTLPAPEKRKVRFEEARIL